MCRFIQQARDLMAVMQPVTGTRATACALFKPTGTDPAFLSRNQALIPEVNGAAREELCFKVGEGPTGSPKRWEIEPGGTSVQVLSILGGERHNLPKGTKLRLDPVPEGLEPLGELVTPATGGLDPGWFGGCLSMVQFESMGGDLTLDAFRAQLGGQLPAVVLVWEASEPADGTTQSTLQQAATRTGRRVKLFVERWVVFVLSKRMDSDHFRRQEGMQLLGDLSDLLSDRQSVDGRAFSTPAGIQIRGRTRITGRQAPYQQLYVYALQIAVTSALHGRDDRTFHPWLRAHNEFLTHEKEPGGARKIVVSQDIDMDP
jgi:hypothetical protein